MKKEIPQEMIEVHAQMKKQWETSRNDKSFYEWMLDTVEARVKEINKNNPCVVN